LAAVGRHEEALERLNESLRLFDDLVKERPNLEGGVRKTEALFIREYDWVQQAAPSAPRQRLRAFLGASGIRSH
jgi:hypothetical protein